MKLIDAGLLSKKLNEAQIEGDYAYQGLGVAKEIVDNMKPVAYIKEGKWIKLQGAFDKRDNFYTCSNCGRTINVICGEKIEDYPYCHCGSKNHL